MQAAGEGAPWACRALFEGASCAMSDDWLLQQRRLQRARQQEAAERARDAAVAAAAQVSLRDHASASFSALLSGTLGALVLAVAMRMAGCRSDRQSGVLSVLAFCSSPLHAGGRKSSIMHTGCVGHLMPIKC